MSLSASIKLARAGLREPEKPIGCYLFSGPTGVGKTEVAKQLAASLGVELIRFDMSEYMERHTVSRLIGAPPGYVGFDQGGLLTDGVDQHPHCVLLLDEIEKAHPDLFNVLLQVMDHGKLTDHNGKQVDFRNVILIMTTNAGASDLAKQAYGFTRTKREGDDQEAINKMFAPEFRNRLDATITFAHLSQEVIAKVVEKFVLQLEAQLGDRNVTIELSDEASRWLIANGYDELMGARPMARVIQEHIKKPLADEVLFGHLKAGGHVRVIVDKDEQGRDKLGFQFLDGPVTPKPEKLAGGATESKAPFLAAAQAEARLSAEGAAGEGLSGVDNMAPGPGLVPGLRILQTAYAVAASCGCAGAMRQVCARHARSCSTFPSATAAFFGGVKSALTSVFFLVIGGTYIGIGALAHDFGFSVVDGWRCPRCWSGRRRRR